MIYLHPEVGPASSKVILSSIKDFKKHVGEGVYLIVEYGQYNVEFLASISLYDINSKNVNKYFNNTFSKKMYKLEILNSLKLPYSCTANEKIFVLHEDWDFKEFFTFTEATSYIERCLRNWTQSTIDDFAVFEGHEMTMPGWIEAILRS